MKTEEREALLARIDALAVRVRQLERAGMPASTAIPPSPAAQGDIIAADSAPAWALLSIGSAREILTVNSAGTGPEWKVGDSARVKRTSNQSIPDNTVTTMSWQSEQFDIGDDNWSVGSPTRLTAQRDGVYKIDAGLVWANNTTGRRQLQVLFNGTTIIALLEFGIETVSGICYPNLSTVYQMSTSDFVELRVFQNSGGALNVSTSPINPYFGIMRIP
jgi:hypothetical protein